MQEPGGTGGRDKERAEGEEVVGEGGWGGREVGMGGSREGCQGSRADEVPEMDFPSWSRADEIPEIISLVGHAQMEFQK